jgi:hypothetical protein
LETKNPLSLSLKVMENISTSWRRRPCVNREKESQVLPNDDENILNDTAIYQNMPEEQ